MFQVMLLARMASIQRHRSQFEEAIGRYEEALQVLDDWEVSERTIDVGRGSWHDRQDWRAHWLARIGRKRANVLLLMGQPREAERVLRPVIEHFRHGGHAYELAQTLFSLGWAKNSLGDLDAAVSLYRDGMQNAEAHSMAHPEDRLPLLQGHLYLGSSSIDRGDVELAEVELRAALALADNAPLRDYREVGRVHQQLGRLHLVRDELVEARKQLTRAYEFCASREDKIQLAQTHNVMGAYQLAAQGPARVERAMRAFALALGAARACRPPSPTTSAPPS